MTDWLTVLAGGYAGWGLLWARALHQSIPHTQNKKEPYCGGFSEGECHGTRRRSYSFMIGSMVPFQQGSVREWLIVLPSALPVWWGIGYRSHSERGFLGIFFVLTRGIKRRVIVVEANWRKVSKRDWSVESRYRGLILVFKQKKETTRFAVHVSLTENVYTNGVDWYSVDGVDWYSLDGVDWYSLDGGRK